MDSAPIYFFMFFFMVFTGAMVLSGIDSRIKALEIQNVKTVMWQKNHEKVFS